MKKLKEKTLIICEFHKYKDTIMDIEFGNKNVIVIIIRVYLRFLLSSQCFYLFAFLLVCLYTLTLSIIIKSLSYNVIRVISLTTNLNRRCHRRCS